jgi:hypothetical protein
MPRVIHALTPKSFRIGDEVRTRCGKSANVDTAVNTAARLIDIAGNEFYGSTWINAVTCKKCINLLTVGTIHAKTQLPRRAANTKKRRPVARNPVGRPKGGRLRTASSGLG